MTDHTATAAGHEHEHPTVRAYLMVYAALMVLLVATVGLAFIDLHVNFLVSMIIAVIKATMVVLIFMHVRYNEKLVWVFAGAVVPLARHPLRADPERLPDARLAEHPGEVVTPRKPRLAAEPLWWGPINRAVAPVPRASSARGTDRRPELPGRLGPQAAGTSGRSPGRPSSGGKRALRRTSDMPARMVPSRRTRSTSRPVRTAGPEP